MVIKMIEDDYTKTPGYENTMNSDNWKLYEDKHPYVMKDAFKNELSFIKNNAIREIVEYDLDRLPKYFWMIPASSSGKYHPKYVQGYGGLVRHTKAAVKIAVELFPLYEFSDEAKDLIVAALILHDGMKRGADYSDYTVHEHPELMAKMVSFEWKSIEMYRMLIARLIHSHMGQWNTSKYSNIVLPVPKAPTEKFVHMCDYLASRKCIEVVLDD